MSRVLYDFTTTVLNGPVVHLSGVFYGWHGSIVVRPEGTTWTSSRDGRPSKRVLALAESHAADALAARDADQAVR
jgi:hypothetical protein